MGIIDRKIASPISVIQNLSRKPTPSQTMTYQELQAKFDEGPEALRQCLNGLIDDIIAHTQSTSVHTSTTEKAVWNSALTLGTNRTKIVANTNIDNIKTPGNYYVASATDAATMTNLPEVTSGDLTVSYEYATTTCWHQTFYAYGSKCTYIRRFYNGVLSGTWVKILSEANAPAMTMEALVYYVNTTTGNDANNGEASGTAFKTIGKAVSMIPQIVNHPVTVNVADGTYSEIVSLGGFLGKGTISFIGNATTPINVKVTNIICSDINNDLTVKGFQSTTTSNDSFKFIRCPNFTIQQCTTTSIAATNGGVSVSQSNGRVNLCVCSNKYHGIIADAQSRVYSSNNTGTGNIYGMSSTYGSVITKTGTQPTGATSNEFLSNGSQIIANKPLPNLGTNGYRYNDDGTILQWGLLAITANTLYKTLTFPIPFPSDVFNITFANGYTNERTIIYTAAELDQSSVNVYPVVCNTGTTPTSSVSVSWTAIGC